MRKYRSLVLFGLDLLIIVMMYVTATLIRFDFGSNAYPYISKVAFLIPEIVVIYSLVFILLKIHKSLWSSSSLYEAVIVSGGVMISANLLWVFNQMNFFTGTLIPPSWLQSFLQESLSLRLPNGVHLIAMLLIIIGLNFARFSYRFYHLALHSIKPQKELKRTLIYGAGDAGQMMLKEILQNPAYPYKVVGFLDDDPYKKGMVVSGVPVWNGEKQLCYIRAKEKIEVVIVAIPSAPLKIQKQVIKKAFACGAEVFTLHGSQAMLTKGDISKSFAKISINDVLGRNEVKLNNDLIESVVKDKVVLVTGAAGSIGSELARQIIELQPTLVIGSDINENELYALEQAFQMRARSEDITIPFTAHISSIRDRAHMFKIIKEYKVDVIFHAAAHKHVPLMETAYMEAIKNNVLGTYKLYRAAIAGNVPLVVSISTDKAVNPTNIMGASKRLMEMMAQCMGQGNTTKFVSVRFGNVLGSNGSVIPLFTKQIEAGGPVTVTHPEMIRYFMSIPEAVSLVLQASAYGEGGEIFVLDMGEPVKILDLAKNMIRLAGLKEDDIKIEFTGLRPGEKMYEELLISDEGLKETGNELIYVTQPMDLHVNVIESYVKKLEECIEQDITKAELIQVLSSMIPTFHHQENNV